MTPRTIHTFDVWWQARMHIACTECTQLVYGYATAASFPISITRGELETSDVMFITLNRAAYTFVLLMCVCLSVCVCVCDQPAMIRWCVGANESIKLRRITNGLHHAIS